MGFDSYFTVGTSHRRAGEPCQDYAVHGTHYGVIADGCSSSPGRADVGARIAAACIERALLADARGEQWPVTELFNWLGKAMCDGWVTKDDLLTTVGGVTMGQDGLQAWLWGDGLMHVRFRDGSSETRLVTSDNETPLYPIYLLDPVGPRPSRRVNGIPANEETFLHWDLRDRSAEIQSFLLATDGIAQLAGMDHVQATAELTAFKTTAGAFLKRRAMRALQSALPVDDIALVAYHEDIC